MNPTIFPLWVLDVLLKASLLLSVAALFLFLARRVSAASRHLVGLFGLLGALALPPMALLVPTVHVPLFPRLAPAPAAVRSEQPVVGRVFVRTAETPGRHRQEATSKTLPGSASAPAPEPIALAAPTGTVPVERPDVPWKGLLIAVWAACALSVLARSVIGMLRIHGIVRGATPVEHPEWLALADELSRTIGSRKSVRLFHSDRVDVAMTAGVRRPVVLLPDDAYSWTPERRRMVLLHEFAHIRRGDCLALLVSSLTSAVYWFHPLVWIISRRIRQEGERAADDLVLSAGARASEYASELLSIVRSLHTGNDEPLPVMALAESSRSAQLEGRLRAILDPRLHRSAPSVLVGRIGLVTLLGFAATVAAVEPWGRPIADGNGSKKVVPLRNRGDLWNSNVFAGNRKSRSGSEWFSQAMSLYRDEHYDRSIEAYKRAIELGYREDVASYNIACDYALQGEPDRAFEWLKNAAEAGFDIGSYLESDDDLESLRDDPRMKELKREFRTKRRMRHRDKAPGAVARFEKLLARAPKDGSGFYEHGQELLRVGEYDKAAQAFQAAAERGSHVSNALYNTACAYALKGDKKTALDFLQKSIEAGYDDANHMERDDDLDAIRDEPKFSELRQMAEDLALPNDLGNWFFAKTRFPNLFRSGQRQAVQRYERFLKSHPDSGHAYFNLGFVELRLDHPREARDAFQKALDLGYRKPTTMYNLACAYARQDQKDSAFEWLFKSIEAGFDAGDTMQDDDDLDNIRRDPRFRKARQMVASHGDSNGG